jgi:hypothetical protein
MASVQQAQQQIDDSPLKDDSKQLRQSMMKNVASNKAKFESTKSKAMEAFVDHVKRQK